MFTDNMVASLVFVGLFVIAVFGLMMFLAWVEQTPAQPLGAWRRVLSSRRGNEVVPRHRRSPRAPQGPSRKEQSQKTSRHFRLPESGCSPPGVGVGREHPRPG